jgi:tetratricopeptide (TPR) repeat protein
MWSKCWKILIIATGAWLGFATGIIAADQAKKPDLANPPLSSSDSIQAGEPSAAGTAKSEGSAFSQPVETPKKKAAPAPAKHQPDSDVASPDSGAKLLKPDMKPNPSAPEMLLEEEKKPEPAAKSTKSKPAEEPAHSSPDPKQEASVSIEAASFKGVTPGASTKEEVETAWGAPKEVSHSTDSLVQLYSIAPFKKIEVYYAKDKVSSIVIRLDKAFPADAVAKQLDLSSIRPVLVSNELGEVLGLAYPERGVLFAFEPGTDPAKASMKVPQIILEPISAEPFVLRAETTLGTRYDLSRHDLEQALTMEPSNARIHWLLSRVLTSSEQFEKAVGEASKAVQLEPNNPQYRATHAQVLAQAGLLPEALEEAKKTIDVGKNRPHVKARALCLVGDLLASGATPDFKKALASHTQALQLADTLVTDEHPSIRMAAKQVLVDAHLGAAHDIAWGEWKEKPKAVGRWMDRAIAAANDLVENEGDTQELLFRVYARALAAYVGVRGGIDPEPTAKSVLEVGEKLIADCYDPGHKAQLQRELGLALYDAVQIFQMRSDHANALKYGEMAVDYLAKANEARPSDSSMFLLGRLYFRLGTICALRDRDHKAAVVWFEKAVPILERATSEDLASDMGRHGESFVSMGVSYWEIGQRDKAVSLTQKGITWMEEAVKQGLLARSSLIVPYNNLSAMHRKLGSNEKANRFQEIAARIKDEIMK